MKKYFSLAAAAMMFAVLPMSLSSCGGSDDDDAPKFKNETFTVGGVTFKMVAVQGGTFLMGLENGEGWEKPVHQVTLSDYHIGETEVTQELWEAVMGTNPSYYEGSQLPVERVSWVDCQAFIAKLNTLTGKSFRLPTEAEWEYAARGGQKSHDYTYSGSNNIDEVAWYTNNSGSQTHNVKQKKPNELGLYDMSGNVWEWCSDWYGSYPSYGVTNPQGASSGEARVVRGGSWGSNARYCRVAYRNFSFTPVISDKHLGFRLVLAPQ